MGGEKREGGWGWDRRRLKNRKLKGLNRMHRDIATGRIDDR